jgi:membrane-bound lytic murein transglycosylase B
MLAGSRRGKRTSPSRRRPAASGSAAWRPCQYKLCHGHDQGRPRRSQGVQRFSRGLHETPWGGVDHLKGRSLKKSNAALFAKIESQYGVPAGVLLAIWGMETGFGSYMGKQNTVSAIVTLAYDCRRPISSRRMPLRRSSSSTAAR